MKQKRHKKGQGFSLLYKAIIVLLLIVVVSILIGRFIGGAAKGIASCTDKGGVCVSAGECTFPYTGLSCDKEGEVCCHPAG